jgi:hydroxyacylglutathione hydrolase
MRLTCALHLVASGAGGFSLTHEFDCNAYLVVRDGEAALIDCGIGAAPEQLLANVDAAHVPRESVRYIVLTHAHPDHCGGAARVRRELARAEVVASAHVAECVRHGDAEAMSIAAGTRAGFYPAGYVFEPCAVDGEVGDGATLAVGGLTLEIIETPGHSDGHICVRMEGERGVCLFSGDLVFFDGRISLVNNWDCRIQAYARSMARLEGAGIERLLPGHHFVSLRDGQRHIDAANRRFAAGLVPASVV